jgi:hypothetical protein
MLLMMHRDAQIKTTNTTNSSRQETITTKGDVNPDRFHCWIILLGNKIMSVKWFM